MQTRHSRRSHNFGVNHMTKKKLIQLLVDLDLRPSRKLGQNFLIDNNILDIIVGHAATAATGNFIEIGAGTGVLTERLAALGRVTAIEYDNRLAEYLQNRFSRNDQVTIVHKDAVRLDYDQLANGPYDCIANLPYAASTAILGRLLAATNRPAFILVLLQREMAERLTAEPRSKAYGSLTVRLRLCYDVKIVKQISANVFWPRPEVNSSLVAMQLRDDAADCDLSRRLSALTRLAFSQRRKKLPGVLARHYHPSTVADTFDRFGIDADVRADALPIASYRQLAETLPAPEQHSTDSDTQE
jgi:16S rRNA (adenine1518-N6/adenine1519-N6)-dimethyltransferase